MFTSDANDNAQMIDEFWHRATLIGSLNKMKGSRAGRCRL